MAGTTGDVERSGRAHKGPYHAAESGALVVLQLARTLPALEDVREVGGNDRSDLTQVEQGQLQRTEEVIAAAFAAGDAALWVIAQALERAAKGRWWRATHDSLTAYVEETVGRSAVYVRQLRMNAPLALETARRTGTVPKPSQIKVTRKTEQRHGLDAAVTLYEVVRDVAAELGGETTARGLIAVHNSLPEQLPEQGDARRAVIEQAARRALTPQDYGPDRGPQTPGRRLAGHWQIRLPDSEPESIGSASIEALPIDCSASIAPADADPEPLSQAVTQDAAVPTARHLRTLEEALAALATIDEQLTSEVYARAATDPTCAQDYERARQHIIIRAAAIRAKALRAPRA